MQKKEAGVFHWAKPSIFNFMMRSHSLSSQSSSLACPALGCSAALRSWVRWRSVASLVCLATGCSAALHTHCLSSLACLTSICSDLLHPWSLWCGRCSLAVALSSRSRHNLSSVKFSWILKSFNTCAKSYPFIQFKFSVYGLADWIYTYTHLAIESC